MELRVYHIRREQLRNKGEFIYKIQYYPLDMTKSTNKKVTKSRNKIFMCIRIFINVFLFSKKKILVLFSAVSMNTKKNRFKHFIVEINILRIILLYFLIFLPFYQIIDT